MYSEVIVPRVSPYVRNDTKQLENLRIKDLLVAAQRMPPGVERDRLLKQARTADISVNLASWADSPGLQPPK